MTVTVVLSQAETMLMTVTAVLSQAETMLMTVTVVLSQAETMMMTVTVKTMLMTVTAVLSQAETMLMTVTAVLSQGETMLMTVTAVLSQPETMLMTGAKRDRSPGLSDDDYDTLLNILARPVKDRARNHGDDILYRKNPSFQNEAPLRPIAASHVNERHQVDLVDLACISNQQESPDRTRFPLEALAPSAAQDRVEPASQEPIHDPHHKHCEQRNKKLSILWLRTG
ncbi:hypothetical protein ACOMHN_034849 [Nucella lapillus]